MNSERAVQIMRGTLLYVYDKKQLRFESAAQLSRPDLLGSAQSIFFPGVPASLRDRVSTVLVGTLFSASRFLSSMMRSDATRRFQVTVTHGCSPCYSACSYLKTHGLKPPTRCLMVLPNFLFQDRAPFAPSSQLWISTRGKSAYESDSRTSTREIPATATSLTSR